MIRDRGARAGTLGLLLLGLLWAALGVSPTRAWGDPPATPNDTVQIGSKQFTESRLLGEIMAQLLEARTDLKVVRRLDLGGTRIVFEALKKGEIDLYAEYSGTGLLEILGREPAGGSEPTLQIVRREFRDLHDLDWLEPLGFNNSYALAVPQELARELSLERISQLPSHPHLKIGLSLEFLNRSDGWIALSRAYGLEGFKPLGMEHSLGYTALERGQIHLMDAYTTDGRLRRARLKLLEDDLGFFPPYQAAPVIRGALLRSRPEVGEALSQLAGRLTEETMRDLNDQVEHQGRTFRAVATGFLTGQGLIEAPPTATEEGAAATPGRRPTNLLEYLQQRPGETLTRIREHLALTGLGVGLAAALGFPLGVLITRWERLAQPVLTAAGVLQTLPGLALLALLIPLLGLGTPAAVAALTLYALLPILRNTWTGLKEVDPKVLEAARGLGMRPWEVLWGVELPLALPTLMAGLRTAAVITVGGATLAAFVGAGGLGQPILTGLYLSDDTLILAGAVPSAALAVAVDQGLGWLERRLGPGRPQG